MELRHFKRVRRIVSIGMIVLCSVLFIDIGHILPPSLTNAVVSFQLVPALIKAAVTFGVWTIGLLSIAALTLLAGRVYCSTLCPLGTLQDLIISISLKWKKLRHRRRWFAYSHPHFVIHYLLAGVIAASALAGSVLFLALVEPFSNFGRIAGDLGRPLITLLNNATAALLESFHSYGLSRIPVHGTTWGIVLGTAIFFGLIAYLSLRHGRLFCNLLCPAGALLGAMARFSLFKLVIDKDQCDGCSLCEKVCKAKCIDSVSKRIDFAACVSCFNCLDACSTDGVKYQWTLNGGGRRAKEMESPSRREFLKMSAFPLVLAAGLGTDSTAIAGSTRSKNPITPPGSGGLDRFSKLCTACQLCVSACPTQVIRPSFMEYGVAGIFEPRMDYRVNYCTYECALCTTVCPTGALLPLLPEEKKEVQLGKVQFVRDDCIVVSKKQDCGACAEHCPTKAVTMVPHEGKLMIPQTKDECCVGCGACEHACPTVPRKAIYIEANIVHQRAKKPEIKKLEPAIESGKDFPF